MVLVFNHFRQESVNCRYFSVYVYFYFPQSAKRTYLFQLIRMLGDRVQSQHFRFLSAQLADVSAHLRAILREISNK
jgi:hypothetical protein